MSPFISMLLRLLESNTNDVASRARYNPIPIGSLNRLYADKDETGDVCFIIGSERIHAHRSVLAAISSKYKTQFYGSQPDKGDVKVAGTTASAFRKFIEFFYLDEIVLNIEDIECVLDLAKQSLVDQFVNLCVDFLFDVTPLNNVFLAYRLAALYDIDSLQVFCEWYIEKNNMKALMFEDFIDNCDRATLVRTLKLNQLGCSETEAVVDACMEWAKAAIKRRNMDSEKAGNLRSELDVSIIEIPFGSVTIDEFTARQKIYEDLFTQDEFDEIVCLIGQSKDFESTITFNRKPRKYFNKKPSGLECNRLLSWKSHHRFVKSYVRTFLYFSCNRSIRLKGFTVGSCIYNGSIRTALISNGAPKQVTTSWRKDKHANQTTITLDEAVDVNSNDVVQFRFDINDVRMTAHYEMARKVSLGDAAFNFSYFTDDNYVTKLFYQLK